MLYLSATTAPLVNPLCLLQMRNANKGNEFWCGELFRFLIIVSLHDKRSMDRTGVFPFVRVLYEEHNNQSTTDGYKFHSCFLIIQLLIGTRTRDGLIVHLFSQLNETKRKTQGRHIQKILLFCCSFFYIAKWKNENMYNGSYFYFRFLFVNWEKETETLLPISHFSSWYRKTKNARTVHTPQGTFPFSSFFIVQRKKRQYVQRMLFLSFAFCLWIRKRENDT